MLDCASATSVFEAIERTWSEHQHARQAPTLSLYKHLATELMEIGFVTDGGDGLELLEHCRRHNLQVVDVLHLFEDRVRAAGYKGGPLNLADCKNSREFLEHRE